MMMLSMRRAICRVAFTIPFITICQMTFAESTRIALLACIDEEQPMPAFERYKELHADLHIWMGDNVYVDTQTDVETFHEAYRRLASAPYFDSLRSQGIHLATWDDHDYGDNDELGSYRLKRESLRIFTEFWGNQSLLADPDDGVYHNYLFQDSGRTVNVILLDVRFNRDQPDGHGDILGQRQWQWLEESLSQPADLTLLVSGTQFLLSNNVNSETWEQYPISLERLRRAIRENSSAPLLMLAGDQHYAEANRRDGWLDVDAVEIQFAGVNQIEAPELNFWRQTPVNDSLNTVGYVDIQWEATDHHAPHLLYRVEDAETGELEFTYRVNLADLQPKPAFVGAETFLESTRISVENDYRNLIPQIRFTSEGGEPSPWRVYTGEPLVLSKTGAVEAQLVTQSGHRRGSVIRKRVERLPLKSAKIVDDLTPGLSLWYAESDFKSVPEKSEFMDYRGVVAGPHLDGIERRKDHYALHFQGFVSVPEDALYEITAYSDDGSVVFIDGVQVVDNDGSHSPRAAEGIIGLEAGLHSISVGYFEDHSGETLEIQWRQRTHTGWSSVELEYFTQPGSIGHTTATKSGVKST